jgi:hypothetical protein
MMNSLGIDSLIVERCLAHKLTGVKGVYNRYPYLKEKRAAYTKRSDHVEDLLAGVVEDGNGEIVRREVMPRKRPITSKPKAVIPRNRLTA